MKKIEEETKTNMYNTICDLLEELGEFENKFETMKDKDILDFYDRRVEPIINEMIEYRENAEDEFATIEKVSYMQKN